MSDFGNFSQETQKALEKYMEAHNINSREEAVRFLLPRWTFNQKVHPQAGRLIEIIDESRHYEIDEDSLSDF